MANSSRQLTNSIPAFRSGGILTSGWPPPWNIGSRPSQRVHRKYSISCGEMLSVRARLASGYLRTVLRSRLQGESRSCRTEVTLHRGSGGGGRRDISQPSSGLLSVQEADHIGNSHIWLSVFGDAIASVAPRRRYVAKRGGT